MVLARKWKSNIYGLRILCSRHFYRASRNIKRKIHEASLKELETPPPFRISFGDSDGFPCHRDQVVQKRAHRLPGAHTAHCVFRCQSSRMEMNPDIEKRSRRTEIAPKGVFYLLSGY